MKLNKDGTPSKALGAVRTCECGVCKVCRSRERVTASRARRAANGESFSSQQNRAVNRARALAENSKRLDAAVGVVFEPGRKLLQDKVITATRASSAALGVAFLAGIEEGGKDTRAWKLLEGLYEIAMTDPSSTVRSMASDKLLDRGMGRPGTGVDVLDEEAQDLKKIKAWLVDSALPAQVDFINSNASFPAFVGGFGSGKTEALIRRMLYLAELGDVFAFYEPIVNLIRSVFVSACNDLISPDRCPFPVSFEYTTSIMEGRFRYGGRLWFTVRCRGMENPETIVGYQVAHSFVDEFDTLREGNKENLWSKIVGRNRKVHSVANSVSVGTTPEGKKFIWQHWENDPFERTQLIKSKTADNPYLPPDYIENLRDQYPDHLLKAYLNGEFVNMTGKRVYYAFTEAKNVVPLDGNPFGDLAYKRIVIGQDFNIGGCVTTIGILDVSLKVLTIIESQLSRDTSEVIASVTKYLKANGVTPRVLRSGGDNWSHVTFYPDASSGSRKTNGESDKALLVKAGFTVSVRDANPFIRDRVRIVNQALKVGKVKILDTCVEVVQAIGSQSMKGDLPEKESVAGSVDDYADSFGYLVYGLRKELKVEG